MSSLVELAIKGIEAELKKINERLDRLENPVVVVKRMSEITPPPTPSALPDDLKNKLDETLKEQFDELREGFEAERQRRVIPLMPTPPLPNPWNDFKSPARCETCGMDWNGAMGYVCQHPKCPSRVVYVNSAT